VIFLKAKRHMEIKGNPKMMPQSRHVPLGALDN